MGASTPSRLAITVTASSPVSDALDRDGIRVHVRALQLLRQQIAFDFLKLLVQPLFECLESLVGTLLSHSRIFQDCSQFGDRHGGLLSLGGAFVPGDNIQVHGAAKTAFVSRTFPSFALLRVSTSG